MLQIMDSTSLDFYSSSGLWITVVVAVVLLVVSVSFHYEMFRFLGRQLVRLPGVPRVHILYLVLALTVVHVIEIWLFAFGYYVLSVSGAGHLEGLESDLMFEYVYFSAVVYTTLGFGDLIPSGALRLLTGVEGLIGLGLITWSSAFTFLQMQRYWPD
jgi:hypothetical protein